MPTGRSVADYLTLHPRPVIEQLVIMEAVEHVHSTPRAGW